jgi:hypothetical protein
MQRSYFTENLWQSASGALIESSSVFVSVFKRRSIIGMARQLTTDLMRSQGYSEQATLYARDSVYLGILMYQGSLSTGGTAYCITTMMEYLRYSGTDAFWGGFAASIAVSLAVDRSPWSLIRIGIAIAGGVASKKATTVIYGKFKTFFTASEPHHTPGMHYNEEIKTSGTDTPKISNL